MLKSKIREWLLSVKAIEKHTGKRLKPYLSISSRYLVLFLSS